MSIKDQIASARTATQNQPPQAVEPSEPRYKLRGFFEKGNKGGTSWVARVVGTEPNPINPKFLHLKIEFENFPSTVEWTSKKGKNPEGYKTWNLPCGFYKAHLVKGKGEEAEWLHFAVTEEGHREDLTQEELVQVMQTSPLTPEEEEELRGDLEP